MSATPKQPLSTLASYQAWFLRLPKLWKYGIPSMGVILVGLVAVAAVAPHRHAETLLPQQRVTDDSVNDVIQPAVSYMRLLDGTMVADFSMTHPQVISVMIENLPEVRPQSGLA